MPRSGALLRFAALVHTAAALRLKEEAARYFLGYLWWVLEPLLYVAVFYLVFEVLLQRGEAHYLVFLMLGKVPFLWFSKTVTLASGSLVEAGGIVGRLDVSKLLFPYVVVLEALYRQLAVFAVLFVLVAVADFLPGMVWLWLLPLFAVQLLLILVCSLLGALVAVWIPDMRIVIHMGTLLLLFASGVFFDVDRIGDATLREWLLLVNPMAFLLDGYRGVVMHGQPGSLAHLAGLAAFLALALIGLHGLYRRLSRRLAFVIVGS